ncbi:MAG: zinc ribbon domain-containing protein [Planctomycetes bacterium]|nr:zinc ribbon domain-containing protein [Planctomycetota bacterium]
MPVYEYTCTNCGYKFDALRSMKDADNPIECKECNSVHTHRMLSKIFAQSNGKSLNTNSGGCSGCSGGTCASCRN